MDEEVIANFTQGLRGRLSGAIIQNTKRRENSTTP